MEKLDNIVFYSIDKAIRTYRQYAQVQVKSNGFSITVDQWLVMKCLMENPDISQVEMSERVFKDNASITRIINLLVKAKYITRKIDKSDRRRSKLKVTSLGEEVMLGVDSIVQQNRAHAANGISQEEMATVKRVMDTITRNCAKVTLNVQE